MLLPDPVQTDPAAWIRELGADSKGIDVGDGCGIFFRGPVADLMIIGQAGSKSSQYIFGLEHFSIIKAQSVPHLVYAAVKYLDSRILHCKAECKRHQGRRCRKDHSAALHTRSIEGCPDVFFARTVVEMHSLHQAAEGIFQVVHTQHMAVDPS